MYKHYVIAIWEKRHFHDVYDTRPLPFYEKEVDSQKGRIPRLILNISKELDKKKQNKTKQISIMPKVVHMLLYVRRTINT